MPTRRWLERALRDCANRADWVARSQEVAIPKKGGGTGMHREHKKFTFVLLMHRSLIRNTSSVGDHGRSPLLPMLRDGRSQQIAFAPDAPHQEITADRLCSRCSRISVLMEMREQICSRSILLYTAPSVGQSVGSDYGGVCIVDLRLRREPRDELSQTSNGEWHFALNPPYRVQTYTPVPPVPGNRHKPRYTRARASTASRSRVSSSLVRD